MSLSGRCLQECNFFEKFSDSLKYFDHLKGSATTTETLRTLKNAKKNDNDSIYQKLQLMTNSAVIEMLFKWFYNYLLILEIFSTFDKVCR